MGQYAGQNKWIENIYQFEQTDVVQGGPEGVDNRPLKELADRTSWLKDQLGLIDRLKGELVVENNRAINKDLAGTLIVANAKNSIINLTLEDPHNFKHGAILPFASYSYAGGVVTVNGSGFPIINPIDGNVSSMHMHHNERLMLVALTDHWKVAPGTHGNFYCAGEEVKSRKVLTNTVAFRGQLLERARYPRLWAFVQTLTMWQEVIDEWSWWNNGDTYKGLYTTGDGVTTFRVPDERGMFDRMLDLGRGVDLSRQHNFAGGYEADQVKKHGHRVRNGSGGSSTNSLNGGNNGNTGFSGMDNGGEWLGSSTDSSYWIEATGGPENIVKNIAKLNLVKY